MNFEKMKVSKRLSIGFGLLMIALAVVSTVAMLRLKLLNEQINELVGERMLKVRLFTE